MNRLAFFGTRLGAECPACGRHVRGKVGQINKCKCGLLLRRSDYGKWAMTNNTGKTGIKTK